MASHLKSIGSRLPVPFAALVMFSGCALLGGGPGSDQASSSPELNGNVATVATSLDSPWSIAFYDHIPLVSERDTARIVELDGEGTAREIAVVDDAAPSG